MQRCMSCLENFNRRQICPCQHCKGWYCPECQSDHAPCNKNLPEKVISEDEIVDDIEEEIDDSKPGIWILKMPEATKVPFNILNYVKDPAAVKMMMASAGIG